MRVRAASLNAADWHVMRGLPLMARLTVGLRVPRGPVRGIDVSGVVAAVGPGVHEWRVGDEVLGELGMDGGGLAEYVAVDGSRLVRQA